MKSVFLAFYFIGMLVQPAVAAPAGPGPLWQKSAINQELMDYLWAIHHFYRLQEFDLNDQRGLLVTLTDIQHEYHTIIKASLHSHVTHDRCLEVILVHGDGAEIKTFAERLMSQKGVESVKLTTIQVEE